MRAILWAGLLFTVSCATPPAPVSADEKAVLDTVQSFFDVIASRDTEAGARLVIPEAVLVSVREANGSKAVRHVSCAQWLAQLKTIEGEMFEAFVGEPVVLIDGDVAAVWGSYYFDRDGQRSHGGVDALTLVRASDGWKIAGGAYSVVR